MHTYTQSTTTQPPPFSSKYPAQLIYRDFQYEQVNKYTLAFLKRLTKKKWLWCDSLYTPKIPVGDEPLRRAIVSLHKAYK